jgi:hypothetical protein
MAARSQLSEDGAVMAGFEGQLQKITDRQKFRKYVDELPEEAEAVLILREPDPDDPKQHLYRFTAYGDVAAHDALWMIEHFRTYLMRWSRE